MKYRHLLNMLAEEPTETEPAATTDRGAAVTGCYSTGGRYITLPCKYTDICCI